MIYATQYLSDYIIFSNGNYPQNTNWKLITKDI